MASDQQDDFMSLYLNFVALMNVSNASRISSKSAHWRLLMESLASKVILGVSWVISGRRYDDGPPPRGIMDVEEPP